VFVLSQPDIGGVLVVKQLVRLEALFIFLMFFVGKSRAQSIGEQPYVAFTVNSPGFPIVSHGKATPILVSNDDWPGVVRVSGDLREDIQRVSGETPAILHTAGDAGNTTPIVLGTIGHSPLIDDLIRRHKLDISGVAGHWESAVTTVVENPFPGISRALVLAGADKRGTIYAAYDLSEQIGVSPWYWWADVRIPHHDTLIVDPGRHLQPEPAVKYRGIFLNDEAPALSGWTAEKFGGMNSKFYTRVFELLLRLKANFLWPAMWNNAFAADDPENTRLADEYGIVMGTSHEEPMMRAEKEWTQNPNHGPWNYATNSKQIDEYWREGMIRNKNYEQIVTLGMRGLSDTPMSAAAGSQQLEAIVAKQREILKGTVNPDITKVPQLWALYKEVQDYYENGMRVPDDVTLLWSDDNWGDLRRVPTPEERKRSGGTGIYYHFDYVGGPRNYKWLNTNYVPKIWEQMHIALTYGADRIWIVNVGDLKPMEFPIEFFLDYARTPARWNQDNLHQFTVDWAKREFGPDHAEDIASIVEGYTRLNSDRKPELLDPNTFSITNYNEADRVAAEWNDLIQRTDALAKELPADEQASFFELVKYPVDASGNVALMYIAAGHNAFSSRLGDMKTNEYKSDVERRFTLDKQLTDEYNRQLLGGKWDHVMDQTHIGYTYWQEPPANAMPAVTELQPGGHELHITPNQLPSRLPAFLRNGQLIQAPGQPPPADFKGFVEQDNVVAIEAADTSARTGGALNSTEAHWVELPAYGEGKSAMTLFPVDAPSDVHSPAGLSYSVYLYDTKDLTLHLRLAPTLNFVPGRGLRVAISVDDGPRQVIDTLEHNTNLDWGIAVSDDSRNVEVPLPISQPGQHTLHIWAVDPAVVLERVIIAHGPLRTSYFGPPESPNNAGAASTLIQR
jgi:Glycosyl hydrolase family 115/Gylcosyl hydrolase family 115 C-terminal domain